MGGDGRGGDGMGGDGRERVSERFDQKSCQSDLVVS